MLSAMSHDLRHPVDSLFRVVCERWRTGRRPATTGQVQKENITEEHNCPKHFWAKRVIENQHRAGKRPATLLESNLGIGLFTRVLKPGAAPSIHSAETCSSRSTTDRQSRSDTNANHPSQIPANTLSYSQNGKVLIHLPNPKVLTHLPILGIPLRSFSPAGSDLGARTSDGERSWRTNCPICWWAGVKESMMRNVISIFQNCGWGRWLEDKLLKWETATAMNTFC